jgi:hypothetical protein
MNARTSAATWSLCVASSPCGAPSYSMSRLLGMPAVARRAEVSIGTVASLVPWSSSVGTRNDARSARKSVLANASAQASVARRPACMACAADQARTSSLTGWLSTPTP